MPKVHLIGKVLPQTVSISVGYKPNINWQSPDIGLNMDFTIHIENSIINVECALNRYYPTDFIHIYMRALDLSRSIVNVVAFKMGYGVSVFLEKFVEPDGSESAIHFNDPALPPMCKSFELENGFDEICQMVLTDPALFAALNDLIVAITLPHASPVNCARAIESIKHMFGGAGITEKQMWEQMRNSLNIGIDYLKFITSHSTDARHGKRVYIDGPTTTEICHRSWVIMDRYFEYLKRGRQPLPPTDFPLLGP